MSDWLKRRGAVWVIDGAVGHLAVWHRSGELARGIGAATVYVATPEEMRLQLAYNHPPKAILIGHTTRHLIDAVTREAALQGVPTFIIERIMDESWSHVTSVPWIYVSRGDPVHEAVSEFAAKVLGYWNDSSL
ncbi:hypothetical protein [Streptomyces sp. NPDC056632]|uniref:hypothetical protein n=1 Tax=Streptomyces sp. NPDC056632 TaxID=3345884 RepID=UPI0036BD61D9